MKVQVSSSSFRMALFVTGIVAGMFGFRALSKRISVREEMKGKSALYGKRKVPAGEDPWKY
uniref:Uncharacterized protein n=1 Tax=Schistosoma mansoni TaxID=6183 RepID=A0AA82N862_SCHMA